VPPLMLQPLVENSLKHGLANGRHGIALALEARREEGWFSVIFSDDGSSQGNGARGFGVGLDNLAQRLRKFAGPGATVRAGRRDEGGYAVALRWPTGAAGGDVS
jgi:two-component system LytT family sensor kinase